jgi:hypothetical protein
LLSPVNESRFKIWYLLGDHKFTCEIGYLLSYTENITHKISHLVNTQQRQLLTENFKLPEYIHVQIYNKE